MADHGIQPIDLLVVNLYPFEATVAKGAEFDILIETRDSQHTQEVVEALTMAGYPPRSM